MPSKLSAWENGNEGSGNHGKCVDGNRETGRRAEFEGRSSRYVESQEKV